MTAHAMPHPVAHAAVAATVAASVAAAAETALASVASEKAAMTIAPSAEPAEACRLSANLSAASASAASGGVRPCIRAILTGGTDLRCGLGMAAEMAIGDRRRSSDNALPGEVAMPARTVGGHVMDRTAGIVRMTLAMAMIMPAAGHSALPAAGVADAQGARAGARTAAGTSARTAALRAQCVQSAFGMSRSAVYCAGDMAKRIFRIVAPGHRGSVIRSTRVQVDRVDRFGNHVVLFEHLSVCGHAQHQARRRGQATP